MASVVPSPERQYQHQAGTHHARAKSGDTNIYEHKNDRGGQAHESRQFAKELLSKAHYDGEMET